MTVPDLIGLFIGPLERIGVRYMITGGVAVVIYGDPRFTRDVDVVLTLDVPDIARLDAAFAGPAFYVPPLEVMEEEALRPEGGHFNLIHRDTALRADVYLSKNDPLHEWGMERRQRIHLETTAIWVAPMEYVILRKLQYYRASRSDRHLRDIAMMLRVSGDLVDHAELQGWLARLELNEVYAEARRFSPEP